MATDPLGLVYGKQEGSGAAQIFGPSGVVEDLRRTTLTQAGADEAARKEAAKTLAPKAPKPQKQAEFGQPWLVDNGYVSEAIKVFTNDGVKKITAGVDISTDPEYLNSANIIKTAIEGSTQQQKLYDQQRNSVINAPDKFDVEATLAQMEEWRSIPLMQRLSTPMPDPVYKKEEEKPIDFFEPFKDLKIGMVTDVSWDPNRESGTETVKPNSEGLMAQIDARIAANPKLYAEGLKPQPDTGQPLWNNREEMRQFYFDNEMGKANYTIKELIRNEAKGNAFGSGYGEEDVIFDTDEWKQAFIAGEENAAAYLTGPAGSGIKTNDGYVLDGVSKVGSFDLNDPKQLKKAAQYIFKSMTAQQFENSFGISMVEVANRFGSASEIEARNILKSLFNQDGDIVSVYRYSGVGKDITIDGTTTKQPTSKEVLLIPQLMTDEQLDAYYISSLKNKKKLYNKDFAVTASGNVRNTGNKKQENTFKRSDLKQYLNQGYTEQELIDYYQGLGYKLVD